MSTHFFKVTGVLLLVLLFISAPVNIAHADTGIDV